MKHLFNQLQTKSYKSTIDNQAKSYDQDKKILADKILKNKREIHVKNEH